MSKRQVTHLNVQRTRSDVANEQEAHSSCPIRTARQQCAKVRPEAQHTSDFGDPPPIHASALLDEALGQEAVRVGIQVEPAEAHYDVVQGVLVAQEEARRRVKHERAAVVAAPESVVLQLCRLLTCSCRGGRVVHEKLGTDGEEGHVLNVGVVLWVIGDEVVHVVIVAPPADAQSADPIGNEDADGAINGVRARDARVPSVVRRERHLVVQQP